jgi:hypothetical protein
MYGSAYFGARFFGKRYFGTGGAYVPPPAAVRSRDYDILNEIRRLLDATGAFAAVRLHSPDEYEEDAPDHEVKAFVEIMGWEEDSDADDSPGVRERRDVTWRLSIEVRDPHPIRRFQRLSYLAELAANTLNGVSYLGQTVAPLSRLARAAYSEADHPYRQVQIDGKYQTLPGSYTDHDAYSADIDLIL